MNADPICNDRVYFELKKKDVSYTFGSNTMAARLVFQQ